VQTKKCHAVAERLKMRPGAFLGRVVEDLRAYRRAHRGLRKEERDLLRSAQNAVELAVLVLNHR
jgi:hypothetical protein